MKKAVTIICLFALWAVMPVSVAASRLEEVKTGDYYFYADSELINGMKIIYESFDLDLAQLTVRVLPVDSYTLYLTFPDGGNMILCLESGINAPKLIEIMDNIFAKVKKQAGFMKILGWKPRLDWFVCASPLEDGADSLAVIADKYKISEIINPPGVSYSLKNVKESSMSQGEEFDLMQVVSPVKMTSDVVKTENGDALSVRISYLNYNLFFIPDIYPESAAQLKRRYGADVKNKVIYSAGVIDGNPAKNINPALFIPWTARIETATDGKIFYISEKIPFYTGPQREDVIPASSLLSKKNEPAVEEKTSLFMKGHDFFKKKKYKKSIFYFDKVLEIDPAHAESKKYIRQALMKMNFEKGFKEFERGNYKRAVEWFGKVLEIDPSHEESKKYIKRANEKIASE